MVRVAAAVWTYLEGIALHRLFVLGFCRKRRCVRSEQSMSVLEGLGPIDLVLDNQRFTCLEGLWSSGPGAVPYAGGAIQAEIKELRQEKRRLKKEVDKYAKRSQEMSELRERLNLLDFKYQLLLDMWTNRGNEPPTSPPPSESEPLPPAPPPSTQNITTTIIEETTSVRQVSNLSTT